MRDISTTEDIKLLVDSFYEKVKKDELLHPVFDAVINDWEAHLPKMYSFWGTLLLNEMSYKGSPFSVHAGLPVQKPHFDQWVNLFAEAVDKHFEGPVAEQAKHFARTNAYIFESKMRRLKL
jgi:hemoglobin